MPTIREIARTVRHAPGLEHMDALWNVIRAPYQAAIKRRGYVTMRMGGVPVRFPIEHASQGYDAYERQAMRRFVTWIEAHPIGLVVDVGTAIGLYAHVALSTSRTIRVLAIDSDRTSLQAARSLAGSERIQFVHGFIGERDLPGTGVPPEWKTPHYTLIGDAGTAGIPTHRLDTLLVRERRPILLKIDIEGAELLALQGAAATLLRPDVTLLVSVHPQGLPRYGATTEAVRRFLEARGYTVDHFATDHEEHWWAYQNLSTT